MLKPAVWCAGSAALVTSLDGSVVNVSLPSIARAFAVDMGQSAWITSGYMVAMSCSLLAAGRLVERFGPWKFISWGFVGYTLFSLCCAASPSVASLIFFRCLQGVFAGALVVSAFTIVPFAVPESGRARVFGLLTVLASVGISLGGPMGGLISDHVSWRWVFAVTVPICLTAACISWLATVSQEGAFSDRRGPIGLRAIAFGALALGSIMIALNKSGSWGWTSYRASGLCVLSLASGYLFFRTERLSRDPMFAWDALYSHAIRRSFMLAGIAYIYMSGLLFVLPFDMTLHRSFTSSALGSAMLAYSIPLMVAGAFSGDTSRHLGLRNSQILAMLLVILGSLALALVSTKALLLAGMGACGAGFGFFTSPNNNAVMSAVPHGEQGKMAASFQTVVRMSLAFGPVFFDMLHRLFAGISGRCDDLNHADMMAFRMVYVAGGVCCFAAILVSLVPCGKSEGAACLADGSRA